MKRLLLFLLAQSSTISTTIRRPSPLPCAPRAFAGAGAFGCAPCWLQPAYRRFALILFALPLLATQAFAGYKYVRTITIQHGKAGGSDSANFPTLYTTNADTLNGSMTLTTSTMTVSNGLQIQTGDYVTVDSEIDLVTAGGGTTSLTLANIAGIRTAQLGSSAATHSSAAVVTDNFLASSAYGGSVQNASGYDVIFASDALCASHYYFDLDNYSTSGSAQWWIKIPLAHATDTVYYVCFDNPAISTFQSTAANVWSNGYQSAWHLGQSSWATSATVPDSAGNCAGTVITNNGALTALAGIVDGAASAGAGGTGYIDAGCSGATFATNTTVEGWWLNGNAGSGDFAIIAKTNSSTVLTGFSISYDHNQGMRLVIGDGTNISIWAYNSTTTGVWYHVMWVIPKSGATPTFYLDGVSKSFSFTQVAASSLGSDSHDICMFNLCGNWQSVSDMDEWRYSNVSRSADYALQSYNNQGSPYSFYTLSASSLLPSTNIPCASVGASTASAGACAFAE